jgi:hypothetical protein
MGLKGMSMLGGQFEHIRTATGSDAQYPERHQIHSVYTHGSKQGVDDTMRGLESQLEWMATTTTVEVEVRIRSDKCNNFCTFSQIPFIVEGNARGWRRDGGKALIRVVSWTFSEAQMGKDQLDVNFSYCGVSFRSYVSGGCDMLTGPDTFKALRKHPVSGTSVLLTDVRCASTLPVYECCPLGIQKVEPFSFKATVHQVRLVYIFKPAASKPCTPL